MTQYLRMQTFGANVRTLLYITCVLYSIIWHSSLSNVLLFVAYVYIFLFFLAYSQRSEIGCRLIRI